MLQDGDDYEPSLLKYSEPDAVFAYTALIPYRCLARRLGFSWIRFGRVVYKNISCSTRLSEL